MQVSKLNSTTRYAERPLSNTKHPVSEITKGNPMRVARKRQMKDRKTVGGKEMTRTGR